MPPIKTIMAGLLAGAVVAGSIAASADHHQGTYTAEIANVRAASFKGTAVINRCVTRNRAQLCVATDGKTTVTLRRIEGVRSAGPLRLVPAPAGGAEPPDVPLPVVWEGCITIKAFGKTDKGCKVITPAVTLEFDPAINEGTIVFSVQSSKHASRKLFATLLIAGDGVPSAVPSGTPTVTPGSAAHPSHNSFDIPTSPGVSRPFTVATGSVRSEVLGGGAIKGTTIGSAFQGVVLHVHGNTNCPIDAAIAGGCPVN